MSLFLPAQDYSLLDYLWKLLFPVTILIFHRVWKEYLQSTGRQIFKGSKGSLPHSLTWKPVGNQVLIFTFGQRTECKAGWRPCSQFRRVNGQCLGFKSIPPTLIAIRQYNPACSFEYYKRLSALPVKLDLKPGGGGACWLCQEDPVNPSLSPKLCWGCSLLRKSLYTPKARTRRTITTIAPAPESEDSFLDW